MLRELEEGRGELTLFFNSAASEETRFQFEEYVHVHLERWAIPGSILRRRLFICPTCVEVITDRQVLRRHEAGHGTMICPVCETTVSLLDREERLTTPLQLDVLDMDRAADSRRNLEIAGAILQGKTATHDLDIHSLELVVLKLRRLHELEKQRAYQGLGT